MDLNQIGVTNILQNKMKYDSARQDIISQNIAGADIPGNVRKDIEKPNFNSMLKSAMLSVNTTNPAHISGLNANSPFKVYETKDKVELDMEGIELMKNSSDFSKTSAVYKKFLNLFNLATGNNK